MESFGIMPVDSELRFGETILSDAMVTLASCGIQVGSSLDFTVKVRVPPYMLSVSVNRQPLSTSSVIGVSPDS